MIFRDFVFFVELWFLINSKIYFHLIQLKTKNIIFLSIFVIFFYSSATNALIVIIKVDLYLLKKTYINL